MAVSSLFVIVSFTLKSQTLKTFCPESPKDSFYVKIAAYLNVQKGDTLADIGSGFGYSMIRIAHYLPGVTFYEEDILGNAFKKLIYKSDIKKSCSSADINAFKFFSGTKTSSKFSNAFFSNVFICLSVHEFEFKTAMLQDVKRIMKPNARLCIMETFYKEAAPKEKHCTYPYMLKPDFLALMYNCGFELVKEFSLDEENISEDILNEHPEHDFKNMTGSFFEFKVR
jgi:ubiquinone/menaquinone biosynthesis C-methylase UbiE